MNVLDQASQQPCHLMDHILTSNVVSGSRASLKHNSKEERFRTFESRLRCGRVGVSREYLEDRKKRALRETATYREAEKHNNAGVSINYKVLKATAISAPVTRRKTAAAAAPSRYVYKDDISEESEDLSDWEELERARKKTAAASAEQKASRALRKLAREARRDQERAGYGSDDEWGQRSSNAERQNSKRPMRRPRRQRPRKPTTTSSRAPRSKGRMQVDIVQELEDGDFDINTSLNMPVRWRDFLPSNWITEVHPGGTSYMPQLYDTVVYFRQGHKEYVQKVVEKKLHALSTKKLPWMKFPDLRAVEVCVLDELGFAVGPPSVCVEKLRFVDNPHKHVGIPPEKDMISLRYRDAGNFLRATMFLAFSSPACMSTRACLSCERW